MTPIELILYCNSASKNIKKCKCQLNQENEITNNECNLYKEEDSPNKIGDEGMSWENRRKNDCTNEQNNYLPTV